MAVNLKDYIISQKDLHAVNAKIEMPFTVFEFVKYRQAVCVYFPPGAGEFIIDIR